MRMERICDHQLCKTCFETQPIEDVEHEGNIPFDPYT